MSVVPPTFREVCTTVKAISSIDWDGYSKTCVCIVSGNHTHNKRKKTFRVSMDDMDKIWPYATQALRVIVHTPTKPKHVAEKLSEWYDGFPTAYDGPVWFTMGALCWDTWTGTRIYDQPGFGATCALKGTHWSATGRFNILEKNYPRLYDAWSLLEPFNFDEAELTVMLKGLLMAPLADAPYEDQGDLPGIASILTSLRSLGLSAAFIVMALVDATNEKAPAMTLPGLVPL